MTALAIEMSIYLAYYKDVIFSLVTVINFTGMIIDLQYPDNESASDGVAI